MTVPYIIYSAAAAILSLLLWVDLARRGIARHLDRRHAAPLRELALRILLQTDDCVDGVLPPMGRRPGRLRLAEVLADISDATDLGVRMRTRRIVERYDLDRLLLHRAGSARGFRRAFWLDRLSRLGPRPDVAAGCMRFLSSRNRGVRFAALSAIVAAEPLGAVRAVANCRDSFTRFETERLVTLLFRERVPVACTPLLTSPHANLRLLGIAVVRRIGADETGPALRRIAASDPDRKIAREAVYAMCALHLPLCGDEVVKALSAMTAPERKSLYRFMAYEGYSVKALASLFREQERRYFESLVDSYKARIVCR